jgi:hypothetical protein
MIFRLRSCQNDYESALRRNFDYGNLPAHASHFPGISSQNDYKATQNDYGIEFSKKNDYKNAVNLLSKNPRSRQRGDSRRPRAAKANPHGTGGGGSARLKSW